MSSPAGPSASFRYQTAYSLGTLETILSGLRHRKDLSIRMSKGRLCSRNTVPILFLFLRRWMVGWGGDDEMGNSQGGKEGEEGAMEKRVSMNNRERKVSFLTRPRARQSIFTRPEGATAAASSTQESLKSSLGLFRGQKGDSSRTSAHLPPPLPPSLSLTRKYSMEQSLPHFSYELLGL